MNFAPIIMPYKGIMPKIDPTAFIAPGAVVIGDVEIGAESSVWPGCVLRGDVHVIRVGARTNIQDGTIVHVTSGGQGTHIGSGVTVGHAVLLHDCVVEDDAFVGMKSCVMDKAVIQSRGMLATGALLTAGKILASGQLWAGTPAKFWRDLKPDEIDEIHHRAVHYVNLAKSYRDGALQ
ncbi:MAG: gamma carbonic anhydrase family protein [Alphaproteobacteria bacterium]